MILWGTASCQMPTGVMPDLGTAAPSTQPTPALPAPVPDVATAPQITCLDSDGIKGMVSAVLLNVDIS